MQKFRSILIVSFFSICAILFFAACGYDYEDGYEKEVAAARNVLRPPELTREQFLEDFDYLVYVLESGFPSFGIIYRTYGVDMLELAHEIRETMIGDDFDIGYLQFWHVVQNNFLRQANARGHLWLESYVDWQRFGRFGSSARTNVTYSYFGSRLEGNSHTHLMTLSTAGTHAARDSQYTRNILQDGKIAYIRVQSSLGNPPNDHQGILRLKREIDAFYGQLYGFEHLIIDIRNSAGGWPQGFYASVIPPLLDEPLYFEVYYFHSATRYNRNNRAALSGQPPARPFDITDVYIFFEPGVLTEYVLNDLKNFDAVVTHTTRIKNCEDRRAPFSPKVWLLIGERNFSGAQHVASLMQQTGFATLVGEQTSGGAVDVEAVSVFFALPNTGFVVRYDPFYIIGADDRPLEYGTVPHHFNRPGMDALETVLALIAEGNY